MRAPVELYRPTILNIIALVSYCLATMFHIIAYATDNWASLLLDGYRWRMGLWQGCQEMEDGTEYCTTDVFENKAFQTGSDWHLGARVMMTLALIILFFLEFTLIGYACIKSLEKYKSQLVGTTIALSLAAGAFVVATLILCGIEALDAPEGRLEWSYGIALLTVVFDLICTSVVAFDRYKTRLLGKSMRKSKQMISDNSEDDNQFAYTNTVVDLNLDEGSFIAMGIAFFKKDIEKRFETTPQVTSSFAMAAVSCVLAYSTGILICTESCREKRTCITIKQRVRMDHL